MMYCTCFCRHSCRERDVEGKNIRRNFNGLDSYTLGIAEVNRYVYTLLQMSSRAVADLEGAGTV